MLTKEILLWTEYLSMFNEIITALDFLSGDWYFVPSSKDGDVPGSIIRSGIEPISID